ncbi:hypothetical protein, partial [Mycobacteroides abscessus]|uniref:hypothetical protein n=1 Tax=Mycobacteroides abscessus TaxID=36809 RepID=UPI002105D957
QLEMSDELIELFVDVPIGYSDSLAEKIYKRAGNRAFLREPMDIGIEPLLNLVNPASAEMCGTSGVRHNQVVFNA